MNPDRLAVVQGDGVRVRNAMDRTSRLVTVAALLLAAAAALPALGGNAGEVRTRSFTLLNQGVSAYKQGDFATAVAHLEEASSIALNNFRAHFYLGLASIGNRDYPGAIEALTIALDLDPDHLQSHVAIGDAYLKMGDLNESRAAYFRSLKLRPEFPPALDGLARVFEADAEDDKAIASFRRAIDANRGYAPAYTHLGDLYLRQNRFEEAVVLLEEAVDVRPDYAPGLNRLALAYGRLGLNNQAIATIQQAIELEPKNASHPTTLGRLQLDQGFVTAAEESFREALNLDPALPEARAGLAEVARRRGEYDAALRQLDIALADPRTEAPKKARLQTFRDRVVAEQAEVRALEERVASGEAESGDYNDLAEIYASRGMWEDAAEVQRQADPSYSQRERLAYMLFQSQDYAEAHEIYSGLALEGESATLALNSGVTLALLGNDEAAAEAYRRALEIDPAQTVAQLYLGNALLRLGREETAVEHYLEFLEFEQRGESAERVRRILRQVAPEALPSSTPDIGIVPGGPVVDRDEQPGESS
jgi:tetratricopeptide (TPR) repeat protein